MNRRSFLTRCLAATCAAVMPWRKAKTVPITATEILEREKARREEFRLAVRPRIPAWVTEDLPQGEYRDQLIARYERRYVGAVEHWTKVLPELGHDGEWIVTNTIALKRGDTVQVVGSPYGFDPRGAG